MIIGWIPPIGSVALITCPSAQTMPKVGAAPWDSIEDLEAECLPSHKAATLVANFTHTLSVTR